MLLLDKRDQLLLISLKL